jgi:erythromycin esterase-like protein
MEILQRKEIIQKIIKDAQPFQNIESADLDGFINRCGDARVILLGAASHGTAEFYTLRSRMTEELIKRCGFSIVAIEWDWPDVEAMNAYIQHLPVEEKDFFGRFPAWMWNNQEFMPFLEHLRQHNAFEIEPKKKVNLYGLDLYCIDRSIDQIIANLESHHPALAASARQRYREMAAWGLRPTEYGFALQNNECKPCHADVFSIYKETCEKSGEFPNREEFFHLIRNMVLVVHAEHCFRHLPKGRSSHWNMRDRYMFKTVESLLDFHGRGSKIIIWAHNHHVGNGAATPMLQMGISNLGQLLKERFKTGTYHVGFGFHHGTFLASPRWDDPMQVYPLLPPHQGSYESLFHDTAIPSFFLPFRKEHSPNARHVLMPQRLNRSFGSVYLPEKAAEYAWPTHLPVEYDEYVWFDETHAISPILPDPAP